MATNHTTLQPVSKFLFNIPQHVSLGDFSDHNVEPNLNPSIYNIDSTQLLKMDKLIVSDALFDPLYYIENTSIIIPLNL